MCKVTFAHDDEVLKWEVIVEGVENEEEARQAFAAVVMTCQTLKAGLLTRSLVEKIDLGSPVPAVYRIIPAV